MDVKVHVVKVPWRVPIIGGRSFAFADHVDTETFWAFVIVLCVGLFVICMLVFALRSHRMWHYETRINRRRDVLTIDPDHHHVGFV